MEVQSLSRHLDDISSTRSSLGARCRALTAVEQLLASTCATKGLEKDLDRFLEAQDAFETNVASRIVSSTASWLPVLHAGLSNDPDAAGINALIAPITQALNILQGVSLLHAPSKAFLGRRWCIQLFLDFLLLSRHAPQNIEQQDTPATPSKRSFSAVIPPNIPPPNLASSVLDTLLCVLVDNPESLRIFEEVGGLEVLIKILKRSGVSRDTRMKCLEFLYFYLLPEDAIPGSPSTADLESLTNRLREHERVPMTTQHDDEHQRPSTPLDRSTSTSSTSSSDYAPNPRVNDLKMLQKDLDFVPSTPKRAQVAALGVGTPGTPGRIQRSPTKKRHADTSTENEGRRSLFDMQTPKPSREHHRQASFGGDLSNSSSLALPTPHTPMRKLHFPSALTQVNSDTGGLTPLSSPTKRHFPGADRGSPVKKTPGGNNIRGSSLNDILQGTPKSHSSMPMVRSQSLEDPFKEQPPLPNRAGTKMPRIRSTEEKKVMLSAHLGNVESLVDGMRRAGAWGL